MDVHVSSWASQSLKVGDAQRRVAEIVILPAEVREDVLGPFHCHGTPHYMVAFVFSALLPATGAASERDASPGAVPTVLVTSRPPRHRVDYVDQLLGDGSNGRAPEDVVLKFHTNPSRSHGVDVVHLTDIARVIGDGQISDRKRIRRAKRFTRLLRRRKIALVRTAHGEELTRPPSRPETILDEAAASVITLIPPAAADGRSPILIGHSHLRDRFLGFPREEPRAGRVLVVANEVLDPAYEATLKVFSVAKLPGWTLRIAGKIPPELEDSYARTLADHVDAISVRDEELSDAARVIEVSQSELVVVVATEGYEGQSVLMLALSLDRPVLVEDSVRTRALADEVGTSWVRRHPGQLTARALEAALAELRADPPTGSPNLDARDPNTVSARYGDVYRNAASGR
ncbi:hypothetical protein [Microbacterium sp. NPDC056234]|uniref:hypothetical protein n=1 Tax=Microbacterium sp. NPDC056234 TaxID=3345757 RepID=UPI0035E02B89